jgi:hypothetical protein
MLGIQGDLRDISSTEALLTYYNDSETLSPGYSLELKRNDKGLLQLKHFNEDGKLIEKDTIDFGSEREADLYLRQRAVDPTTAMKSLVERDKERRTAAAEAALEQSKLATERYGDDMGYKKEQMKAVASALEKLRDDKTFFLLNPDDRDSRIKGVYDALGLTPPSSLGLPPTGNKPPVSDVEKALKAYDKQKEEEARVDSEVESLVDLATGSGITGYVGRATGLGFGQDQARFDVAYAAATPEQQKQVDERIAEREAQTDITTRALTRNVPRSLGLPAPLGPLVGVGGFLKDNL